MVHREGPEGLTQMAPECAGLHCSDREEVWIVESASQRRLDLPGSSRGSLVQALLVLARPAGLTLPVLPAHSLSFIYASASAPNAESQHHILIVLLRINLPIAVWILPSSANRDSLNFCFCLLAKSWFCVLS